MKAGATSELVALLRGPEAVLAFDLLEFTLGDGTVLRYTTADVPLVYEEHIWRTDVLWDRSQQQINLKAGLEVDTLQLTAYATPDDLVKGIPFHDFLRRGGFDGAYLRLRRAYYFSDFATDSGWMTGEGWFASGWFGSLEPVGVLWLFSGRISDLVAGGLKAQINIKSPLETLDRKLPRNLYQAPCGHILYDAGCAVAKDDYAVDGEVQPGSTNRAIQTRLSQADGWFDLGLIRFTSGALDGTVCTIKRFAGGVITVIPPLIQPPVTDDTFTAWPGCDRTLATCQSKFNNRLRFRGMPWIPVPETAR